MKGFLDTIIEFDVNAEKNGIIIFRRVLAIKR